MNPLKNSFNDFICNKNPLQVLSRANPQNMLMNMLKQQNPQGYETLMNLIQSGNNPDAILTQYMNNMTPDQKQQLQQFANQFGIK